MNDFFNDRKNRLKDFKTKFLKKVSNHKNIDIPDGLFIKCEECSKPVYEKELDHNLFVCPNCGFHFRIDGSRRLEMTVDKLSFIEIDADMFIKST